jgi:hypothetical protein
MLRDDWSVPSAHEESEYFSIRGNGSDETWDAIENLADVLKEYQSQSLIKPVFDSVGRELVHTHLVQLEEDVLSDADFWRYLSAIRFRELVTKRHPVTRKSFHGDGVDGNWSNFGAQRSDVRESLFFRLFVGADLAFDESTPSDPYHLTRVHDVDLWQSHIIRVFSGDNPEYARALVRWFKKKNEWYGSLAEPDVEKLFAKYNDNPETRHLRDLVKRVRRIRSNVIHEFLTEDEVLELVTHEALLSLGSVKSWGQTREAVTKSKPKVKA